MKYLVGKIRFPRDKKGNHSSKGEFQEGITQKDWRQNLSLLETLRPDREENPSSSTEWEDQGEIGHLYLYTGKNFDQVIRFIRGKEETEENLDWEINPDPNSFSRIIAREFSRWRQELTNKAFALTRDFNQTFDYIKNSLNDFSSEEG